MNSISDDTIFARKLHDELPANARYADWTEDGLKIELLGGPRNFGHPRPNTCRTFSDQNHGELMNIEFIATKIIEDNPLVYIDVIKKDDEIFTQLLEKQAEPNFFGVALIQEGDTRDTIYEFWLSQSDAEDAQDSSSESDL